ncbi:MAG: T9SS type A sorting domain-containing protein [Chitinophagales bacterium]
MVAFDLTTSIQQQSIQQPLFTITPNPANNILIISSTSEINAPIQITISKLNGMQVFNNAYYMQDTMQLNLPQLPDGLYVIQILNNTVQHTQTLLIIQP